LAGGASSTAAVAAQTTLINDANTQAAAATATGNATVIAANNTVVTDVGNLATAQAAYDLELQTDETTSVNPATDGTLTADALAVAGLKNTLTADLQTAANSMATLSNTNLTNDALLPTDTTAVATAQTKAATDIQTAATASNLFDPTNTNTYNSQTSLTIYDSLGSPHILSTYYVKGPSTNSTTQWDVYSYMSEPSTPTVLTPVNAGPAGTTVAPPAANTMPTPAVMTFDSNGKLVSPATGNFALSPYTLVPATGAAPISIGSLNFSGSTQVQAAFSVNTQTQNGLPAGQLTGISINAQGIIAANFSNGGSQPLGQVALSNFPNTNGLEKVGNTQWAQSASSGSPILGTAGSNNFGAIQSGAVEASNVNLSNELVNLIIAQQTYQANAKTITTENNIMTTILQIQ
jgi:flagellar hook protein FlgE